MRKINGAPAQATRRLRLSIYVLARGQASQHRALPEWRDKSTREENLPEGKGEEKILVPQCGTWGQRVHPGYDLLEGRKKGCVPARRLVPTQLVVAAKARTSARDAARGRWTCNAANHRCRCRHLEDRLSALHSSPVDQGGSTGGGHAAPKVPASSPPAFALPWDGGARRTLQAERLLHGRRSDPMQELCLLCATRAVLSDRLESHRIASGRSDGSVRMSAWCQSTVNSLLSCVISLLEAGDYKDTVAGEHRV